MSRYSILPKFAFRDPHAVQAKEFWAVCAHWEKHPFRWVVKVWERYLWGSADTLAYPYMEHPTTGPGTALMAFIMWTLVYVSWSILLVVRGFYFLLFFWMILPCRWDVAVISEIAPKFTGRSTKY